MPLCLSELQLLGLSVSATAGFQFGQTYFLGDDYPSGDLQSTQLFSVFQTLLGMSADMCPAHCLAQNLIVSGQRPGCGCTADRLAAP